VLAWKYSCKVWSLWLMLSTLKKEILKR
jgi:hypothetical protein